MQLFQNVSQVLLTFYRLSTNDTSQKEPIRLVDFCVPSPTLDSF